MIWAVDGIFPDVALVVNEEEVDEERRR